MVSRSDQPDHGPEFALLADSGERQSRGQRVTWGQTADDVEALPSAEAAAALGDAARQLREQLARRIVGMDGVIEHLLISLFSGGHTLLIGVPGLAKTLLISSLAELLQLPFARIQFTPDLMPSDITGAEVLVEDRSTGVRHFEFLKGPIFASLILADEINRTPPKTQSALLEAMEERQVTSVGKKQPMESPFFVLATQNPIEQEGTYPLPVSQLDRFMFNVLVDYPAEDQEYEIVRKTVSRAPATLSPVLERARILQLIRAVRELPIDDAAVAYAIRLGRQARPASAEASPEIREWVQYGPGPRGTQYLILGAKARAMLDGRSRVAPADIRAVLPAAFRHRILLNYHSEVDGIDTETVIDFLLERVPSPDNHFKRSSGLARYFGG